MMGYHNGNEADYKALEAAFERNPYTQEVYGSWTHPGNGRLPDYDLDLVKDAADFFEQQCAAAATAAAAAAMEA